MGNRFTRAGAKTKAGFRTVRTMARKVGSVLKNRFSRRTLDPAERIIVLSRIYQDRPRDFLAEVGSRRMIIPRDPRVRQIFLRARLQVLQDENFSSREKFVALSPSVATFYRSALERKKGGRKGYWENGIWEVAITHQIEELQKELKSLPKRAA